MEWDRTGQSGYDTGGHGKRSRSEWEAGTRPAHPSLCIASPATPTLASEPTTLARSPGADVVANPLGRRAESAAPIANGAPSPGAVAAESRRRCGAIAGSTPLTRRTVEAASAPADMTTSAVRRMSSSCSAYLRGCELARRAVCAPRAWRSVVAHVARAMRRLTCVADRSPVGDEAHDSPRRRLVGRLLVADRRLQTTDSPAGRSHSPLWGSPESTGGSAS